VEFYFLLVKMSTLLHTKKFILPLKTNIHILKIKHNIFLIFKNEFTGMQKYFLIPSSITTIKYDNFIVFSLLSEHNIVFFKKFCTFFNSFLKKSYTSFKRCLILNGLGLKLSFIETERILEMKLGYSHLVNVSVPQNIFVKIDKNIIIFESFNSVTLGNFVNIVKHLKFPDVYKGKGFWYKSETKVLKEIKKT